ncbi:hypothetical protein G4B88_007072 [Cannabis sativa]|uniref:RNase H type-1 domain-containing protein n=1 Tax=Cannabis sativa TaxID=3483 RepID=A0A7J6GPB6_CANSA|nr:hypothetical protein G4B88_007072 [Cannabis sativa]
MDAVTVQRMGLVRKDINGLGFAIGPTLEGHGPSKKRRHGETSFEGNNWANTGMHELVGPIKKMFSSFINDNSDKLGKEYEVKEGCPVGNFDKGNANYHNNTKWRFCDMKKKIWDEFHFQWKLVESERGDSFDGAPRPAVRWKQPRPGRIWVNANFPTKDGVGAIGVVTWDEVVPLLSVTHGELEAIGKDAEVLRRLGIKEADILSDNQVVVQAHSALVTPFWNVFFLFSKALTMLSSKKIEVLWIPKTKNSSAHVLAKWGLFNNCKGFLNCWEVTPAHRDLKSL